jgi:hypothetical protein
MWLAASTLITVSLVSFAVLNLSFYGTALNHEVNENLKSCADQIEKSVANEFANLSDAVVNVKSGHKYLVAKKWWKADKLDPLVSSKRVDIISWLDESGMQTGKLVLAQDDNSDDQGKPPLNDLSDRAYFTAITGEHSWTDVDRPHGHFYVDSVVSKTTGENVAILALPAAGTVGKNNVDNRVVAAQIRPSSLFHTFLPPSFGFAIIDPDSDPPGKVLFHSQDDRNLREWMFDDVLNTAPLRAVMFGGGEQLFTSAYLGRDHRLLARPFKRFAGSRWVLVVFSDKEYFRSALADIMTFALTLFGLYVAGGVICFGAWVFFRSSDDEVNPLVWIWPNEEKHGGYYGLIAVLALGSLAYLVLLVALPPLWLVLPLFLLPVVWLAARKRLSLSGLATFSEALLRALSPQNRYIVTAVLVIFFAVVMPCVASYRVAYDSKMRELARHELLLREKHLRQLEADDRDRFRKYFGEDASGDTTLRDEFLKETEKASNAGVYSSIEQSAENCKAYEQPWIEKVLKQGLAGYYDQTGVETFATEDSKSAQFQWCRPADGKERLRLANVRSQLVVLSLHPLSMFDRDTFLDSWIWALGLLILAAIALWVYVLCKNLFELGDVAVVPEASIITQHTLLLTDVHTARQLDWGGCTTIDLVTEPYTWAAEFERAEPPSPVVLLHLEAKIDDPSAMERLARLILASKDKVRFVVCYLGRSAAPP